MRKYLYQTLELIRKRKYDEYISYKLCATIRESHTNKLISVGFNRSFSGHHCEISNKRSIYDYHCNAVHAEQDAICRAKRQRQRNQLLGSTIYIARIKPNGLIGNAKPCEYCLQFIMKHDVSRICYTLNEDEYVVVHLDGMCSESLVTKWMADDAPIGQLKRLCPLRQPSRILTR